MDFFEGEMMRLVLTFCFLIFLGACQQSGIVKDNVYYTSYGDFPVSNEFQYLGNTVLYRHWTRLTNVHADVFVNSADSITQELLSFERLTLASHYVWKFGDLHDVVIDGVGYQTVFVENLDDYSVERYALGYKEYLDQNNFSFEKGDYSMILLMNKVSNTKAYIVAFAMKKTMLPTGGEAKRVIEEKLIKVLAG